MTPAHRLHETAEEIGRALTMGQIERGELRELVEQWTLLKTRRADLMSAAEGEPVEDLSDLTNPLIWLATIATIQQSQIEAFMDLARTTRASTRRTCLAFLLGVLFGGLLATTVWALIGR